MTPRTQPAWERVVEPRVGFRKWSLRGENLCSWLGVRQHRWPRTAKASCLPKGPATPHSDPAPHLPCTCGLYAYYSLEQLVMEEISPPGLWMDVAGAVVAWGHIIECTKGLRAQYMRPVALLETPLVVGSRVAERYDVPVLPREDLVQYAGWFGRRRDISTEVTA